MQQWRAKGTDIRMFSVHNIIVIESHFISIIFSAYKNNPKSLSHHEQAFFCCLMLQENKNMTLAFPSTPSSPSPTSFWLMSGEQEGMAPILNIEQVCYDQLLRYRPKMSFILQDTQNLYYNETQIRENWQALGYYKAGACVQKHCPITSLGSEPAKDCNSNAHTDPLHLQLQKSTLKCSIKY